MQEYEIIVKAHHGTSFLEVEEDLSLIHILRARLHHDMQFFTDEVSEETLLSIIDKICACAQRAQKAGVDVVLSLIHICLNARKK